MRRSIAVPLSVLGTLCLGTLLSIGISYISADPPRVLSTVSDDQSLPTLEVNGIRLHLETWGDPTRETVILLHGGPGNDYRHLLPLKTLGDEYHLVFYDQRGAGLSQRVESSEISLDAFIGELDAVAAHFSPERAEPG